MLAFPRRTLADLPPPSTDIFAPHSPWCPIPARMVTETLNVDHGLLGVWRMRGVGPKALPAEWTKGHRHAYRIDSVLSWLADRRGEAFDIEALHLNYLVSVYMPPDLIWVPRLAKSAGPVIGNVRFTASGFESYIGSLSPGGA